MKKLQYKLLMAALVASAGVTFVTLSSPAAAAGPIVPYGHTCLEYSEGGTDCSFTSYGQCLQTASGIDAECYGDAPRDDRRTHNVWNGDRRRRL